VSNMRQAIGAIRTLEITRATRATKLNGLDIKMGQAIGLIDGELLAAGDDDRRVVMELLNKTDLGPAGIITIYYGEGTGESDAGELAAAIRGKYPDAQVEVVAGGQPHYRYILSVE